jgi:UDP-N-acetylmuramate--alanine ligase
MKEYKKAYFIGIGGSGMSALAKLMCDLGIKVSGSDKDENEMNKSLKEKDFEIFIGHDDKNISSDVDCVVYTVAIPDTNPELIRAREINIPVFTYAQMLGEFSKDNFTVAISGTHGKTTTTAMTADVFIENNRNPYVIVGSVLNKYNSNYIKGKEDVFIVESCEYKKSFLNLSPNILAITNIDFDHLDFYKSLEEVQKAFKQLIDKMPEDGIIVCDPSDSNVSEVIKNVKQKIVDYSEFKKDVPGNILGEHNISNAAVSLAVSSVMNFDIDNSIKALESFEGTKRRLQCKGKTIEGALVYDDYAHHPTAISVTIDTLVKRFKDKKIIIIFQPHTYSRTKGLKQEFIESLQGVEEIILLPIYAAREDFDSDISSEMLAEGISKKQKVTLCKGFDEVVFYLKDKQTSEYLIVTMGAGDVFKIGEMML